MGNKGSMSGLYAHIPGRNLHSIIPATCDVPVSTRFSSSAFGINGNMAPVIQPVYQTPRLLGFGSGALLKPPSYSGKKKKKSGFRSMLCGEKVPRNGTCGEQEYRGCPINKCPLPCLSDRRPKARQNQPRVEARKGVKAPVMRLGQTPGRSRSLMASMPC